MDCRTTQSHFQNFINGRLNEEETVHFIDHLRSCDDCMNELTLYYTMFVSLRQLENNEPLTSDYARELQEDIENRCRRIQQTKKAAWISNIAAATFLSLVTLWGIIAFIMTLI